MLTKEDTLSEQEMSMEDVQSELSAAMAADGLEVAPIYRAAPVEQPNAGAPASTPKGDVEGEQEQPATSVAEDSETFAPFNPDTLPAELVPAWKQLQGAFTQKTQAVKERERQLEALGSIEDLQEAAELYNRLSDPDNWAQLHEELTEAMEAAGLTPAEARAVVNETAAEVKAEASQFDIETDDPELAPFVTALREERAARAALEARFQALDANLNAQREAEEAEQTHRLHILNMQRQVGAIREANKHYGDRDMQAVVKLGSFFNDDLSAAQADLEDYVSYRFERWLQSKEGSQAASLQPHAGAGISSDKGIPEHETLDEAAQGAEEEIRLLMETGELDFS